MMLSGDLHPCSGVGAAGYLDHIPDERGVGRRGRHHDSKVVPKRDRKYLKKNNIFLLSDDSRLPVDCKRAARQTMPGNCAGTSHRSSWG
jgi:hypothetical protein